MGTVKSADGTTIAFTSVGSGQPLIIVDGATAHRAVSPLHAPVGELLGDRFQVITYDRRGRGESGDTKPYAVEREIEDLAALIEYAGSPAIVTGFSSGAVLSLHATAAGLPVSRLALFEPPFVVDDGRPPLPSDYVERLEAAVADGRPADAAEFFLTAAAGVPAEFVGGMKESPFWAPLEAVAHTISYDGRIMGPTMSGRPLPADAWSAIDVPVLVMHGTRTEPWLAAGARAAADLLPTATLRPVDGEGHSVEPAALAEALTAFAAVPAGT
jgi:pimeloyl-ACP methyl ester carboxylesterase